MFDDYTHYSKGCYCCEHEDREKNYIYGTILLAMSPVREARIFKMCFKHMKTRIIHWDIVQWVEEPMNMFKLKTRKEFKENARNELKY